MACALEEAERFLWRYPQVVLDVDDPIEMLRVLVSDCSDYEANIDKLEDANEKLKARAKEVEQENIRLLVIIKGQQRQLKLAREALDEP